MDHDAPTDINLRDLFAAAALAGLNSHHDNGLLDDAEIVEMAWRQADMMLDRRFSIPKPEGE